MKITTITKKPANRAKRHPMTVPFFRPGIGEEEQKAVAGVLASGWLTTGSVVRRFERRFATYLDVPEVVALNSCTAALHLALEAAGVRRGDLVLVPSMTFAATAEVVRYLGARPVLVDSDPETLCIDPNAVEDTVTRLRRRGHLKAVIPVHYGGQMADMTRLREVAERHGLRIVEDAAHTLPAYLREGAGDEWRMVGNTSGLTCFSLYANKCITTGEGGMVAVHEAEEAERIRLMSLHGLSAAPADLREKLGSWCYEIVAPGYKYNLTDVAAAIGLCQLEKADEFWRGRRRVARAYQERLAGFGDLLEPPRELPDRRSSWHLYPIRLRLEALSVGRDLVIKALRERGVACSVHWMPLHLHSYYRRRYGYGETDCPVAGREWRRLISLPIYPSMTEDEIDYVTENLWQILTANRRVFSAMAGA